jgi:hypothetical protein
MRWQTVLGCLCIAGCAAATPPATERVIPTGPPPEQIDYGFDRTAIEYDLLASVRARFGEPTVRRALQAETYLLAKHYPGWMPPPPPAGTPWQRSEPLVAMLVKENGHWLVALPDGWRIADASRAADIETILNDPAFWAEPEWGQPGCTHFGASIFILKVPDRPEIVRRGVCGPAQRGERLVLLAAAS